jgi:filamentous hemagglutinin family protein
MLNLFPHSPCDRLLACALTSVPIALTWMALPAMAQLIPSPAATEIIPANDGTGTIVVPSPIVPAEGGRVIEPTRATLFDIQGGQQSGDRGNLFHSFEYFNLNRGDIANFRANAAIRNILVRVVGGRASYLDGQLQMTGANANLFLLNPSGILFGQQSRLNLPAAFTASTAQGVLFGDRWFRTTGQNQYAQLQGDPQGFAFAAQPGAIANLGNLAVNPGQSLALLGGTVLNLGQLTAPGGEITIAAIPGNHQVRLSQPGRLLNFVVSASDLQASLATAAPTGQIAPQTLPQLLAGFSPLEAAGLKLNPDGSLQLLPSNLTVSPQAGTAIASGQIRADNPQGTGGQVTVVGDRVGLVTAQVSATGATGGGRIRIGGDYQGQGSIPNARHTVVSRDSWLNADALQSGNGGQVVIWSDRHTGFSGHITARGGAQKHQNSPSHGGQVEISGRESLSFQGHVDVGAIAGQAGHILFDPRDITIVTGSAADDPEVISDSQILFADGGGADFVISSFTLASLTGDITLQATRDINLQTDLALGLFPGRSFTLTAGRNFNGAGQNIFASTNNVTIAAADISIGNIDTGAEEFNGGAITLTAASGNISAGNLISKSGAAAMFAGSGGNITLTAANGIISTGDLTALSEGTSFSNAQNGGAIVINALGNISTGAIDTTASSVVGSAGTGGSVSLITSGGNLILGNLDTRSSVAASSELASAGGNVTLTADNGSITTGNVLSGSSGGGFGSASNGGTIALNALTDVNTGRIDASASSINGPSVGNGGNVAITSQTGAITINDDVNTSAITDANLGIAIAGNGGTITITGQGSVSLQALTSASAVCRSATCDPSTISGRGGDIQVTSQSGAIQATQINTATQPGLLGAAQAGSVTFTAATDIQIDEIDTSSETQNAGDVRLTSTNGTIAITGTVNASSNLFTSGGSAGNGGTIAIDAAGDITTNSIFSSSAGITNSSLGNGGAIAITSRNGSVTINNLVSSAADLSGDGTVGAGGAITISGQNNVILQSLYSTASVCTTSSFSCGASSQGGRGGDIQVTSQTGSIQATRIDSSTRSPAPATSGNAGNVTFSAARDIQIGKLNAEGGQTGSGGTVQMNAGQFFQASGLLSDPGDGLGTDAIAQTASLSAQGGSGAGSITIRHAGGQLNTPFQVGSSSVNGVTGTIVTGLETVANQSFTGSFISPQGTIQLLTQDIISPLPTPPRLPQADAYIQPSQPRSPVPNPPSIDDLTPLIETLETELTEEFSAYLGLPTSKIKSLQEIQRGLRQIETTTGVRTALIYIFFRDRNSWQLLTDRRQDPRKLQELKPNDQLQILLVTSDRAIVREGGIDPVVQQALASQKKLTRDQNSLVIATETDSNQLLTQATQRPIVTYEITQAIAEEFYDSMQGREVEVQRFEEHAKQLYDWLVRPIEADLQAQKINHLAFLMPTKLRSFPFAALHDGQDFIIKRYSVGLMPSFSLLVDADRYRDTSQGTLWALGTSQFFPAPDAPEETQLELPSAEFQLQTLVSSQVWGGNSAYFFGSAFQPQQLQPTQRPNQVKLVHLLTHASFTPGKPENSYIYFWQDKLTMPEMPQLQLNNPPPPIELLVLHACQTAQGDGEAELGFAGAAAQARVKTVLASLWSIRERDTFALTVEFYRQLRSGKTAEGRPLTKAEAFRRAQWAMATGQVQIQADRLVTSTQDPIPLQAPFPIVGSSQFTHPSAWAGVTLIGTPW